MPGDAGMTNDENKLRMTKQIRMRMGTALRHELDLAEFVIRYSSLIRYSGFVIRHSETSVEIRHD